MIAVAVIGIDIFIFMRDLFVVFVFGQDFRARHTNV